MDGKQRQDPDFDLGATIRELYALAEKLEMRYVGRHFTPDGHMVGSLGEVYAEERYGLELLKASTPIHDAKTHDGRLIQIKATQGGKIALGVPKSDDELPHYLIALRIDRKGNFEEVYNGPARRVWEEAGKPQKTGQMHISLAKLRKLAAEVDPADRIPAIDAYLAE